MSTTTVVLSGLVKTPSLTTFDRCDSCGAQAMVEVDAPTFVTSLLFCKHHYDKHQAALGLRALVIRDDRELLLVRP